MKTDAVPVTSANGAAASFRRANGVASPFGSANGAATSFRRANGVASPFGRANGAASSQPGAAPQERHAPSDSGLKARPNPCAMGSGLQPSFMRGTVTQGVALGWDKAGALPRRNQSFTVLDAKSAEVLGNIRGLLA